MELPGILGRRLDALAAAMLQPPGAPRVDFSGPPGAPALVGPDSVSWRIFKNPVALFTGGVAAVLLELAEPRVRDGVWQHSGFRRDALTRLQRTGLAAMVTVYAPREVAAAMIAGVVRMHERVRGTTGEGQPYAANDRELLDWVQATAMFGFLEATHAYVRPVARPDRDRYWAEGGASARLYGALGAPRSQTEFDALLARMTPRLVPSPVIGEFLAVMRDVPALPAPARPLQRLLLRAAVDLVPRPLRRRLGIAARWGLQPWQRPLVQALARAADRLALPSSPAVQASRRLGLPGDHLFR